MNQYHHYHRKRICERITLSAWSSCLLLLLLSWGFQAITGQPYYTLNTLGVRNYTASEGNPMKGLAATYWSPEQPLVDFALEFNYVRYDQIVVDYVNNQNVYDWTSFEAILNACASRKRQLVPRVFINYVPYNPNLPMKLYNLVEMRSHTDFGGGISPYYGDADLLTSMQQFISVYGARYDGDPRIAYIQTGLIGFWAEWHTLGNPFIPDDTRTKVLTWYRQAFKETPVMTRYPSTWAKSNKMGYHDDSWTYSTLDGAANGGQIQTWFTWPDILSKNNSDVWRYAPLGGETRPENVDIVLSQSYAAGTPFKQDFFLCATTTHTVYMKHGSFKDAYQVNLGRFIHTNMGYNYNIRTVTATSVSSTIQLDVTIEQIGYTPFYYPLSLNVMCPDLTTPLVATGVEKLIDQFQTGIYSIPNVPATSSCLSAVTFTLSSTAIQSYRPMKWAQGQNGIITINIPLPSNTDGNIVVGAPPPKAVPVAVPGPVSVPVSIVVPAPIPIAIALPAPTPVGSFTWYLVNADTDKDVDVITPNKQYGFNILGTRNLSVRVDAPSNTKQVIFTWFDSNNVKQTANDNAAPWYLRSNTGTDVITAPFIGMVGIKSIQATAYETVGGRILASQTMSFSMLSNLAPTSVIIISAPMPSAPKPVPIFITVPAPTAPKRKRCIFFICF